jgi:hypothetical protein
MSRNRAPNTELNIADKSCDIWSSNSSIIEKTQPALQSTALSTEASALHLQWETAT